MQNHLFVSLSRGIAVIHAYEKKTQRTAQKTSSSRKPTARRSGRADDNEIIGLTGSDNIFWDTGFPPAEAINLLARSNLMSHLQREIEARGLTQEETAKVLGVRQPRISDLVNDRLEKFTVDMLMENALQNGQRSGGFSETLETKTHEAIYSR